MTAIARELQERWRKRVASLSDRDRLWCYSRKPRLDDPPQGWKLHLSATPLSANEVFSRAWPVLDGHDAFFKVAAHLDFVAQLNAGLTEFSQVGKFLTVYPRSTGEAVHLARELHIATRGLDGPRIPFDARYRTKSLVYYRYGPFRAGSKNGAGPASITDSDGKSHLDKRGPGCAVPRWLNDPFARPSSHVSRRSLGGPLAPDYLVYRAISQRGKGGVYEAIDLSVSPARIVIVKEGRRHGETTWAGEDGYTWVKREGSVLQNLRRAGIPVPQVFREMDRDGHRYLVLEKVEGRPLIPRKGLHPSRHSWQRADQLLNQLGALLSKIHDAGWVWRDCKPSHVFVRRGEMRPIDFEGACRIDERRVPPWGSVNYSPADCLRRSYRRPGTREDDFALGVMTFQMMCGEFPPSSSRARSLFYRRADCPVGLRARIEDLLN